MTHDMKRALGLCGSAPSLVALAVWLLNDAFLKYEFPSLLTGKLSDVAGLFVAPCLVLVVLLVVTAPLPRRLRAAVPELSFVLVAAVFAALKLDAAAAHAIRAAAVPLTGGGTVGVSDPTDLVALPALGLSYILWRRSAGRALVPSRRRYLPMLAFAALATVATTPGVPPRVQLISDPWDPTTVVALYVDVSYYGGSYPRGIFVTRDAGEHWRRIGQGADVIAADPRVPGRYLAARGADLYVFAAHDQELAVDEPAAHSDQSPTKLVVPAWGRSVYVLRDGTLSRAADAGKVWESMLGYVVAAAAGPDDGLLYAIVDGRVRRSVDGGATWTLAGSFSRRDVVMSVDPQRGDHLIASTPDGLLRSTDGGASWSLVHAIPSVGPRDFTPDVAFDPLHTERVYATVGVGTGLLVSGDGGATWRESELPADAVTVTRASERRVFIASDYRGVYRNSSAWPELEPWTRVSSGLPYPGR